MPMIGKSRRTTANGTTLAWTELGDGPPIVLLHGLADSHRSWRLLAPPLSSSFRVIMLDLPGHGLSERPNAPYTLAWYAETVAAWMHAIGVDKAHVCGHSYGGGVSQWMLMDHRERIDRLALLAPGGLGREVALGLRLATLPLFAPMLNSAPMFSVMTRLFMQWTSRSYGSPESAEAAQLALLNSAPQTGRAFRKTASGCIGPLGQRTLLWNHIDALGELPPLAVYWGARDTIVPVRHAREVTRRLANVSVTVYPKCGHSAHLEVPELFASDVTCFFTEPSRTPAYLRPVAARNHAKDTMFAAAPALRLLRPA
jgi:pimeloyl-ACP methyl ester carboxylesterase